MGTERELAAVAVVTQTKDRKGQARPAGGPVDQTASQKKPELT